MEYLAISAFMTKQRTVMMTNVKLCCEMGEKGQVFLQSGSGRPLHTSGCTDGSVSTQSLEKSNGSVI